MRKKIFNISLALLCLSSGLKAQDLVDSQLKYPIQNALQTNRELIGKSYEKDKTSIEASSVKNKLTPHISANALYGYLNAQGNIDVPTYTSPNNLINLFEDSRDFKTQGQMGLVAVTATQVIFSGLQITHGQKALQEKAKAQELMIEADKESIAKSVISTFDQLMLLKEVDKLIQDSEIRLEKEHLKVIKAIENGLAIPYDRDKLKLAILELEAKKVELHGNKELLYNKLAQDTHLPLEELKKIDYTLDHIILQERVYNILERKEIQALDASQRAFEYVLKKEKGSALPQVFAFGSAAYSNIFNSSLTLKQIPAFGNLNLRTNSLSFFPTFIIGVGAKWDVFTGNEHKNKIKSANLDLLINQNKKEDISEKLELLLQKNQVEYQTANQKLAVNKQQLVVAQNNLDLAIKQYKEGLVEVTERLSAENDYYKANLGYYSQILQQRQSALEILHTSGDLLNRLLK